MFNDSNSILVLPMPGEPFMNGTAIISLLKFVVTWQLTAALYNSFFVSFGTQCGNFAPTVLNIYRKQL
jgi:hypothetical protein